MGNDGKEKVLEAALERIKKQFGEGAIMRLGDASTLEGIESISTGALSLDLALGVGGLPKGRIVELFGPEASGKTTLALHVVAEAQKAGGKAAYIDAEHALDPQYASRLGVRTEELLISQPDSGEQALEIADLLIRSGGVDLVVIDSVAALVPKAELEGEMGDSHMGLQARLMSQAMRKVAATTARSGTLSIFINQLREKIGVFFGNPEVTPGGRALKFYSSVRLEVRRGEAIKIGSETLGHRVRAKVVKNKVAPPFRTAQFDIIFGEGISKEGCLIDLGLEAGIIARSGSWYSCDDTKIGQGREATRLYLRENPELAAKIEKDIRAWAFGTEG